MYVKLLNRKPINCLFMFFQLLNHMCSDVYLFFILQFLVDDKHLFPTPLILWQPILFGLRFSHHDFNFKC